MINRLINEYQLITKELAGISDDTERYAYFIAWVNSVLESSGIGFIVVTGGFAVEVYTGRVYRTMDVDLICSNQGVSRVLEGFLSGIGESIGRGYLLEGDLALKSIDIVSSYYDRAVDPVKVLVRGRTLYLDPPEYLITAYLSSWRYWGSSEDRDKALWLLTALNELINHELLRELAVRGGVEGELNEVLRLAERVLGRVNH